MNHGSAPGAARRQTPVQSAGVRASMPVARDWLVLLAGHRLRHRVGRPACNRRFGAIARQMILERVEYAEREAGPDRGTEIKRHPDNLVLPLGKVVRHDPTRAHIVETRERPQKLAAIGDLSTPSAQ